MVSNQEVRRSDREVDLAAASKIVLAYSVLTVATVASLVVLSVVAPAQATNDAWGHAVVVLVFAVVLLLRMRATRNGSARAARAVTIIAAVLVVVNLVEAAWPDAFPTWMRVEMLVIAGLMAVLVALLAGRLRWSAATRHGSDS